MANWWEAAPVVTKATAGSNWWEAAPLAKEAASTPPTIEPGKDGGPKRLVMDMSEKKPDRGVIDATARGAAQGFTANFGDEIRGLVEASGANPNDPASLSKLVTGALKYWTGDAEAKKKYDEAVKRERDLNKTAEEQHPIASTVGNIAGAVALPIGAAGQAATLPGRMGAGVGLGMAMGGAAGAGEGVGAADTIGQAAFGAGVGGIVGGAAPAVLAGAALAGRGVARLAQPLTSTVRSVTNRDGEAARRILLARARDAKSVNPGMSAEEFAAAKASGSPVINADMGGEATQALARSAANTSQEGRAALEAVTSDRYATQSPRIAGWLKEKFDFPSPGPALERLEEAARRENRPAYAKAYSEGQAIWDDGLEQLVQAPVVQQAIRLAFVTGRNKAALDGFGPIKNPFVLNRETGALELQPGAIPNLQFWDHVKRNLDKVGGGEGPAFARALRDHLDDIVPSYGAARAGAAKFFGAEDALEAGGKFATMSGADAMSIAEARKGLASLKPGERKLFETGFVANLIAKVESLKDGQDVVKNIFNSEFAKAQIKLVLGEQRASELEAKLLAERAMNGIKAAIQGNSTTVRQWVERGLAGGATGVGGIGTYEMDPQKLSVAALAGVLVAGSKKIDQRVARRVAEMLASDNPKILEAGTNIVARMPIMRSALLKFDAPLTRAASEQSGGFPAIQSMGASRAESNQPEIPREGPY
jgi:hypothetical protein